MAVHLRTLEHETGRRWVSGPLARQDTHNRRRAHYMRDSDIIEQAVPPKQMCTIECTSLAIVQGSPRKKWRVQAQVQGKMWVARTSPTAAQQHTSHNSRVARTTESRQRVHCSPSRNERALLSSLKYSRPPQAGTHCHRQQETQTRERTIFPSGTSAERHSIP